MPDTTFVAALTPVVAALAATALALCGLAALVRCRRELAGTTLVAVWAWSIASLAVLGVAEVVVAIAGQRPAASWVMPLRLAAAAGTFCPVMALLGAKRPQDRGWQFIVAALWGILSLPSFHWLLFGPAREMHPAQLGFLAILIGTGAINGLATRYWPSSVLYGFGQMALVAGFFSSTQEWLAGARGPLLGLALVVAAFALRAARFPRARPAATPLDCAWLDFRDAFGAVWGLRIMERMNAAAAMYGWPVTLTWSGFVPRDESGAVVEVPAAVEDSLRTLLRRFVSPQWIDERLGATAEGQRPPARDRATI